ncbi:DUF3558 family protein [Nocardia tengchongensis]
MNKLARLATIGAALVLLAGCNDNPQAPTTSTAALPSEQAADYVGSGPWTSHYFLSPDQSLGCAIRQRSDDPNNRTLADGVTVVCQGALPQDLPPADPGPRPFPVAANEITFVSGKPATLSSYPWAAFTEFPPTPKILPYGHTLTVGAITCTTDPRTGITCHDTSRHGFMASTTTVYLTPTPTRTRTATPSSTTTPDPADDPSWYPCWGIPGSALTAAGLDPRTNEVNGLDNQKRCTYQGSDGIETILLYPRENSPHPTGRTNDPNVIVTALEINGRAATMTDVGGECGIEMNTAGRELDIVVLEGVSLPDRRPVERKTTLCEQAQSTAKLFEPYLRR